MDYVAATAELLLDGETLVKIPRQLTVTVRLTNVASPQNTPS